MIVRLGSSFQDRMYSSPIMTTYSEHPGLMTCSSVLMAMIAIYLKPRNPTYSAMAAAIPGMLLYIDVLQGPLFDLASTLLRILGFALYLPSLIIGPIVLIQGAVELAQRRPQSVVNSFRWPLIISLAIQWAIFLYQEFIIDWLLTPIGPPADSS